MRTGTRDKAVVQPVSLPSSRTETWGKLLGSPVRLCARFLALVSWCPGCVGGPCLWPSVPVLSVCSVASCALGLVASSGFVSETCFFLCFCFEASALGTFPKTGFSTGTLLQPGQLRFTSPWDLWMLHFLIFFLFSVCSDRCRVIQTLRRPLIRLLRQRLFPFARAQVFSVETGVVSFFWVKALL